MRIVCPNCNAEYEIDQNLIPDQGRDVQCSSCGNLWFVEGELSHAGAAAVQLMDEEPEAEFTPSAPAPPPIDEEALSIIREEVERETNARIEENTLETQSDLGLDEGIFDTDDFDEPDVEPQASLDNLRRSEQKIDLSKISDEKFNELVPEPKVADSGPKSNQLPDIEEIETKVPEGIDGEGGADPMDAARAAINKRRRGFRAGFGLMLLATTAVMMAYVFAPRLAERFPQFEDQIFALQTMGDDLRWSLDDAAQDLVSRISELAGG